MRHVDRFVIMGASGFVGSAVMAALRAGNHQVAPVRAPRLPKMSARDSIAYIESKPEALTTMTELLTNTDVVINAAGQPDASARDSEALASANGVLPGLIAAACTTAGVSRYIHVSSAVVQGRLSTLDESEAFDLFSEYSKSKALGERLVTQYGSDHATIYRPPSVHGPDRRVSRLIARVGASPISSVAKPPTSPSPQALIENVADAIAFLATADGRLPRIVIHPWEELTTEDVLHLLGGRKPMVIPRAFARSATTLLRALGRLSPSIAANARRLEMLWFGQAQVNSWLTTAGWTPPAGREAWGALRYAIQGDPPSAATQGSTEE